MTEQQQRKKQIQWVLWVTLFLNIFVAVLKIIIGHSFNFASLSASGLDSFFDASTNIMGLISLSLAAMPADDDHNYGHHKYESIGAVLVGLILLASCYEVGRHVFNIMQGRGIETKFELIPLVVTVISLLTSLFVSKYEYKKGQELKSGLLMADAQHTFGDFLIGIAIIISIFSRAYGLLWVDITVGIGVVIYLFYTSIRIIRYSLPDLLDSSFLLPENLEKIINSHNDVKSCTNIRSRGNSALMFIDFEIQVDPELSVRHAHEIAHEVEDMVIDSLKEKIDKIDVTIHVEPSSE